MALRTALTLAAMALLECSDIANAAPAQWECTAPPNYFRHIANGITKGPVYAISGDVAGIRNDDQTGEWAPSASAIIFTPDKRIMAAVRIIGGGSESKSLYDIVFVRNFGNGMVTEKLGQIGLGQKLSFELSWSADGVVTANLNGQKRTVAFKPLGEAIAETTCSGGSFTFTDLQFSPAGDGAGSGSVKTATIDSRQ